MGFFFRKSINLGGGIKLNFSKSGLGVSFGVKGLRTSINKKGITLNAGRKGMYYRKHLSYKKLSEGVENVEEVETFDENSPEAKLLEYIKEDELSEYKFCNHCGKKILKADEFCSFCGGFNHFKLNVLHKIFIGLLAFNFIGFLLSSNKVVEVYVLTAFLFLIYLPIILIIFVANLAINHIRTRKKNNLSLLGPINYYTQGAECNEENS